MFHHFSHFRHGREKLAEKLQQVQKPEQAANKPGASSGLADSKNDASAVAPDPTALDSLEEAKTTMGAPGTQGPSNVLDTSTDADAPKAPPINALGASIDTDAPSSCPSMAAGNIFQELSNDPPCIPTRKDHPVPKTAVRSRTSPVSSTQQTPLGPAPETPLQTNKFCSNMMLGEQTNSAWTQPYSLWWSKGRGNAGSWGMSITHTERSQFASGPRNSYGASNYFFGPIGMTSTPFIFEASLTFRQESNTWPSQPANLLGAHVFTWMT